MASFAAQAEASRIMPVRATQAFKRVLVHVDRDGRSDYRIEVAANLAERFAGKVTGVYVARSSLPPAFMVGALPPAVMTDQEQLDQEAAETARRRFLDHVVRRGLDSEWHYIRDATVPALRRVARYVDVAIVGQTDPTVREELLATRPEDLALGSGRPVLVVPYIGGSRSPGRHIVVAWDGSREAARAVADALPLLMQASVVRVVSIDAKAPGITDQSNAAEDLGRFLADHGIAAKPENLQTDECSEADVLLSRIGDFGADLLVMGCYGHTRLRELVLGGMTREILQHMNVCVLMSH
jgi:nucleotide-binding universal stress UspA family protein